MSLSETRVEILQTANQLRPTLLEQRFDWWRRGGISGQAGEMVSRSRGLPMPAFDRTDRSINADERAYRNEMEAVRSGLMRLAAIEQRWLIPIHIATKEEREKASDDVQCLACLLPIVGSPRSGFCKNCSTRWYEAGKPDRVWWIKQRREFLEMDEALEA